MEAERSASPAPSAARRAKAPAETLAALVPRMAEFGITRVADITGLDRVGIPVAIAVRPAARSVTVSQGKGADLASAKVSALMEAVEVWHAETIQAPLLLASIDDVCGRAVDVARLPPGARPRAGTTRALWIEGRDLASGAARLVPFEMVHADYSEPVKPGHGFFPASTNGLASGNDMAEALLGAVCELVERDALSVWHARPLAARSATRVEPATIGDPAARWAMDLIAAAGLDLAIWDVTSDLGIPAFLSLVRDAEEADGHPGLGSGAHPVAAVALMRALTEAAQTRLTYISGSRDDLEPREFTDFGRMQKRRLANDLLRAGPPARRFEVAPSVPCESVEGELAWVLARLNASGIGEAVAVDLSKAHIGIPVVRAVIPGLEAPHDDPGYVPGVRARAAAEGGG